LILITGTFLVFILEGGKHTITTIAYQPIYSQPDSLVLTKTKTDITLNLAPTTDDNTP
jgi:hypothetical protein